MRVCKLDLPVLRRLPSVVGHGIHIPAPAPLAVDDDLGVETGSEVSSPTNPPCPFNIEQITRKELGIHVPYVI
ncbi:unnamed protein product [Urochloa humidicola]